MRPITHLTHTSGPAVTASHRPKMNLFQLMNCDSVTLPSMLAAMLALQTVRLRSLVW